MKKCPAGSSDSEMGYCMSCGFASALLWLGHPVRKQSFSLGHSGKGLKAFGKLISISLTSDGVATQVDRVQLTWATLRATVFR